MPNLACPHCAQAITPLQALQRGIYSWPEMGAWWSLCPSCPKGGHYRAEDNFIAQYKWYSENDWPDVTSEEVPGLRLRADPSFLHLWLDGHHYEFPARR